jgi:drug/metabolite transporter (DMT)-like permease
LLRLRQDCCVPRRRDALTILALAVGIATVSSSGALIVLAAAPGLAIAFWRNALAVGTLAPISLTVRRHELRGAGTQKWSLMAGLALAVHFGTWVPSIKLTTIATSTALVCLQPIWTGLIAAATGRRLDWFAWLGIAAAVAGVLIAVGPDLRHGGAALLGDLLAIIGGIAGAVYTLLGERARQGLTTTTYTFVCYGVCAAALLLTCVLLRVPLLGYSASTWAAIAALTVGAQLLGHSMFNYAVHKVPATTISVLMLLEVPGAGLLGWLLLGQRLPPVTLTGLALLIAGVAAVLLSPAARTVHHQPPASGP